LILALVTLIYGGIGIAMLADPKSVNQQEFAGMMFLGLAAAMVFLTAIFFLPQIIGGWKLFKQRPSARIWAIIGSILALLSMPLGTAAGVYGLWFIFGEQGQRYFDGGQIASYDPPPERNW
ncbi:MAG: hypothetical protein HKN25_01200, partial [Pyrinomonadaceae bacterium]|nr:hypothetical protein [Pyrinomonadaceae bacterium]